MITAKIDPTDIRTTQTYVRLSNRTRVLESRQTVAGRFTHLYGTDDLPKATIDQLGNRTTFVRDGSGKLTARINPLGHRTTNGSRC